MYLGRIVEEGPTPAVIAHPRHPYTQALWAVVPEAISTGVGQTTYRVAQRRNSQPAPSAPRLFFSPRGPYFVPGSCDVNVPKLEAIAVGGSVACPIRKDENLQLIAQAD